MLDNRRGRPPPDGMRGCPALLGCSPDITSVQRAALGCSTVQRVSTTRGVSAAGAVDVAARHHTRAQYRAAHSTIACLSTADHVAPYSISVPGMAYHRERQQGIIRRSSAGHSIAGA
eukprot:1604313-Rhodomonas_salina.1